MFILDLKDNFISYVHTLGPMLHLTSPEQTLIQNLEIYLGAAYKY